VQAEYGGPVPPEKPQWAELFTEVVTSGLCTGCSACVIACPYDVLGYDDTEGNYRPFHVDADGGPDNCTHGLKGCTLCTRACPRFRTWEPEIETHLFGRPRTDEEVAGIARRTVLARATDSGIRETGQDGGLVSALLIWAFEHELIDAALVSGLEGDGSTWKAVPRVARSKEDVLATAGSRYTYSANPLAYADAIEGGAERIALVGMGCQASAPPVMAARKAGKVARRFTLSIGLLCSKTFDDAIFPELFEAKYGLARADIATHGPVRGARAARTSPPSTPTSRPGASARSVTGPSPCCGPRRVRSSSTRWRPRGSSRRGPSRTTRAR
jgi:coenzyme F420 hydrogenase subunit beta